MFSLSPSQTQSVSSPVGKGTQRETLMSILQRSQKRLYIQFQSLHRQSRKNPAHPGTPVPPLSSVQTSILAVDTEIFLGLLQSISAMFQGHPAQRHIQGLGRNPPRDLLGATPIPTSGSRSTDWIPNSGLWNRNLPKCYPTEQADGGSLIHPPERLVTNIPTVDPTAAPRTAFKLAWLKIASAEGTSGRRYLPAETSL